MMVSVFFVQALRLNKKESVFKNAIKKINMIKIEIVMNATIVIVNTVHHRIKEIVKSVNQDNFWIKMVLV